ncbi:isochorismate synthase [Ancylobacter sp. MQZ15Z-1]|uniref:isochorismate synthase n=1 Tax=Ancylobacter mangrovi TaxID=2972472 RepID=A0A9X2PDL4_9HYPH|nr:isochorismate synthase [Ancylobacter mangrovi]MCS0496769.1 isochorismate synthase [Ancylobacter mangrovi]
MRDAGEQAAFAPALPFALVSDRETVVGKGSLGVVAPGTAPLEARVRALLAARPEGPRLVLGALPFDAGAPAHLFQPAEVARSGSRACFAAAFPPPALVRPASAHPASGAPRRWTAHAEPSLAAYRAAVAEALRRLERGDEGLRKVVLSRSLRLACDRPIETSHVLRALAEDPLVTAYCVPLPEREAGHARALVGATPELLVSRQGTQVLSRPLAGSARRSPDAGEDRAAAEALSASDKDRREHREVVTAILDQLAPYCAELGTPDGTSLTSTATMWHLGTRIVGRLRDPSVSSVELATRLHPTPAVCGTPREAAAKLIAELEGYDRGFYAGAVGWCDEAGDGAWHVAIRCAEIEGGQARLYAGAGIVPGSDPVAEGEETSAKFAALLRALGVGEEDVPAEDME